MTLFTRTLLAAALLSGTVDTPASTQGTADDVKCLLASNIFSKSTDEKQRGVARLTSFFYLGRIDGRLTSDAMATAFTTQRRTITPANVAATMTACTRRMEEAGKAMQALGERLARQKP